MNTHRKHDFDDGFDEESLFEDEEYRFEQLQKRTGRAFLGKSERSPHDREDRFRGNRTTRRRPAE